MQNLIDVTGFERLSGNIGKEREVSASPICSCDCAPACSPQCSCPPVDCASCRANDSMSVDSIWGPKSIK